MRAGSAVKRACFSADLHRTRLFSKFGRRKRGLSPVLTSFDYLTSGHVVDIKNSSLIPFEIVTRPGVQAISNVRII